jgi:ribosomal protein S18 acetylase RimI-like enzyme
MDITCRPAEPADIAALRVLDTWLPHDPKRSEEIAAWVGAGQAHVVLAGGETAGYGVLTYSFFHEGFIEMVMVGARFRRMGIGAALVVHFRGPLPHAATLGFDQ